MTGGRGERGSALVIAITVMAIILTTSLATMAFIDRSQARSGGERVKETSFNLAEAVLNEEVLVLSVSWPSSAEKALPATCAAPGTGCPDPAQALAGFPAAYTSSGIAWRVQVRDNLGDPAYYSRTAGETTACAGTAPCTWDSNGDGSVWVRTDFTVRGRTRSLVALVRQQQTRLTLPRNTITAGFFKTTNKGLKVIVDEKGCQAKSKPSATCNTTDPAPVVVRCTSQNAGASGDPCLGFRSVQVSPTVWSTGYSAPTTLSAGTLAQMKTAAVQAGTYFNAARGCPTAAQATGRMVYVDGLNCSYTGGTINSAAAPGTLVVNAGTLILGGNTSFYGVLYAANGLPSPADAGNLITLSGTAYVQGAMYVEGNGGVLAGASGVNVSFDPNVLSDVTVAGTPVVAQNSFRELPAGQ